MSADGPTTSVPVAPGSRLHFSWGLGSELRLMDVQDPSTQEGGEGGHATQLSWGQVSASNRIIAFGTAEQYAEVQRSRLAGGGGEAEDGGLSALEAALWQLLELFFDFVSWLAVHGDALAALTGQPTLGGRLELELLDCLHFGAARAVWRREAGDIAAAEQLFAAAAAASKRTAEGVRSVLGVLLGEPAALRAATTDWLEAAAAEAARGSEGASGLLDLLAELLQSLLPVGVLGGGWALALGYLAWCPTHGAAAAEALMEALPVDSRDTRGLEKTLAACRRLGLGAAAAVLCRVAGVDALGRGMLGAGAQWMVRASDPRRTAAALALVGGAVEEALIARMVGGGAVAAGGAASGGSAVASLGGASYRAGALQLPGGDELEALLEWLPGGSSGGVAEDAGEGGATGSSTAGSGGRGLAAFLVDVLRLSRAMGALGAARDSNAPPEDARVTEALSAGRAALLSMARRRTPPRRLCLPLLFYCIPLLEATAGGGRLLSSADMQDLLTERDVPAHSSPHYK
eukprot:XP_001694218.1 predicted protein [Chlamydomonas reinhardtii]